MWGLFAGSGDLIEEDGQAFGRELGVGGPDAVLDFVQPLQAIELDCGWEVGIGPDASAGDCEFEAELGEEVL